MLIVEVNPTSTYEDNGMFYLTKIKVLKQSKDACRGQLNNLRMMGGHYIDLDLSTDTIVALFTTQHYSSDRRVFKIIPLPTGKPSGTYTGAVFYNQK